MIPPTETDRIFQEVLAAANCGDASKVARLFMEYEETHEFLAFPVDFMNWTFDSYQDTEISFHVTRRVFALLNN